MGVEVLSRKWEFQDSLSWVLLVVIAGRHLLDSPFCAIHARKVHEDRQGRSILCLGLVVLGFGGFGVQWYQGLGFRGVGFSGIFTSALNRPKALFYWNRPPDYVLNPELPQASALNHNFMPIGFRV